MDKTLTPILTVSTDAGFHADVEGLLAPERYSVTSRQERLSGLNGTAASLAARHECLIFDLPEVDAEATSVIETLDRNRLPGSLLVAVTGADLALATARALRKAGVDEVLPREALQGEMAAEIDAWQARRAAQLPAIWTGAASQGRVIAVARARGGVGATTFAVNLADALQGKRGLLRKTGTARVAALDLDVQFGSLAALTDVEESDAIWQMAMDGTVPDDAFVEQAVSVSKCGVSVFSAPTRVCPLTALAPEQVGAILSALRRTHDYVVVDLPQALVEWIEPVLSSADRLFLATDLSVPSVRAARRLIDVYMADHPALDVQILACQEGRPLVQGAHHKAAAELLERPLGHWVPADPRAAREALDRGRPLSEIAPRSRAASAIRKIARETAAALPPPSRLAA